MAFGIGKKLKKGLGSIANKVADKLIPKELAPFLPMLAPLFMGPGAGIMSRYLMPQLLAALSTGKTSGDISGTGQALAGLGSFLSDPGRFKLGEQEVAATADQGTKDITKDIVDKSKLDPNFLESDLPGYGGVQGDIDFTDFQKGGRRSMYGPDGGSLRQSPAVIGSKTVTNPSFVPGTPAYTKDLYTLADLKGAEQKASILDYLKVGGNEARDFIQGTNIANKAPGGDQVTVGTDSQAIGKQNIDIYNQDYQRGLQDRSALQLGYKDPALMQTGSPYAAGDSMQVRDANFGYNMPRRAVQTGIATLGPTMNKIDRMKQEAAAAEAEFQGNLDAYGDAKSNFFDYFKNAKPNYGMLYGGGYADGGRIGLDEGGFLSNILGDSTVDDIQRGIVSFLGGGSLLETGMSEYDEAYEEMLDAGISEEEALDMLGPRPEPLMQANGGRVNKNIGGIMNNMGSIPQTPMIPQGQQLDGRGGGFIPMGAQEKQDDVPAMLAKNEFVMTSDAVRAAGGGSIEKGAQRMYDMMNQLEAQV